MRASTAHIQMQRKPPGYRQDILPSKETSLKASRTRTTLLLKSHHYKVNATWLSIVYVPLA